MRRRFLGSTFEVSRLALGGGGIGQVWGPTTRDEGVATVHAAYEAGIDLFDMAPIYGRDGEAETVLGLAFSDGYPDDVRVTTKCLLGATAPDEVEDRLTRSLEASLARMRREHVDLFFLHGRIIPDGWRDCTRPEALPVIATEWSVYQERVVPTFEKLMADGRIGAWGITAASCLEADRLALETDPRPQVAQCVSNVLDSPGSMRLAREAPAPRAVIRAARENGVGVMGIRAASSGSLCGTIDRAVRPDSIEQREYDRAAGFRSLAKELGIDPAALAHRYALDIEGVDTVVLGVKNRAELQQCVDAASAPRLEPELIARIDETVRHEAPER